ncbi:MAG: bifunctional diaminohydroxyphosphoribosylaminopyrimidine deaminase/5-amino-6-(5-phosphoribosylamino)uracil reductase RibD [Elusimicrobia bacterium]|nr:bifunctional diaminohydroxyphosphoribosylaminopyrimidine deaminase/5-amino-6-(5-phosphoribosylamino)uracil reductase RibD [Elusimicrobiota bacterium]
MKYSEENIKFMRRALALARKGGDLVYPNPMVGCVIVKDGKIIGEGYHKFFGGKHAEVNALDAAGADAAGADMYVTLEPCATAGKQPACAPRIAAAKIRRVFYAHADVNKKNALRGVKILRRAGVEVYGGILAARARALNKRFIESITSGTTRRDIKFAMTLDGKIASKTFDSKWITCKQSLDFVHILRTKYDAVLIGTNTVLKDNPFLTAHGKGTNPARVIIDENLQTPAGYNIFDGAAVSIFVCGEQIKNIPSHFKQEKVMILKINFDKFKKDFKVLIRRLNDYGLKKILIEGGGETISSALFSGAVSGIYAFVAPKIIGGRTAITPVGGQGLNFIKDALKVKNIKVRKIGRDFLITGSL